jgi:FAD/FMN-containing dehydrogenase
LNPKISEIQQGGRTAEDIAAALKSAVENGAFILPFAADNLPSFWQPPKQERKEPTMVNLDLSDCSRILDWHREDQVICVQTGIPLAQLDKELASKNQWIPLSFGARPRTLLQAIVTGDGGALDYYYGGPRRIVLGLTVALSNGDLIRTGGQVVKNVTGYDLTKLMVGSYAVFGLPVSAYLRLYARPEYYFSLVVAADDRLSLLSFAQRLDNLGLPAVSLELADKRVLLESSSAKATGQFLLISRVAGYRKVLKEAVDTWLKECRSQQFQTVKVLEAQEDKRLWLNFHAATQAKEYEQIEVDASYQTVRTWYQSESASENWLDHRFSYTPGLARFKFFPYDQEEKNALIGKLRSFAKNSREPITIAYTDERYIKKVERLAIDSSNHDRMFAALKRQFDPSGRLNPFVQL